jgi:hypothetical protein
MPTTKEVLNRANPDTIPDHFRALKLGSLLRGQLPQVIRKKAPAANSGGPGATVHTIVLPDDAKASQICKAYGRAGTAGTGVMTIVLDTPDAAGEIGIQPDGNLMVLAADALTSVDVSYVPERGDVVTLVDQVVASNVLTLPSWVTTRGVILLLEATATAGTLTGRMRVLTPSASAPATTQARLNVAKTTVTFATADAVTKANVKLLLCAAEDLDTILEADATIL